MTRDELAALVLRVIAERCDAVSAAIAPPVWQSWNRDRYDEEIAHGPRYTPGWFGDLATTEAGRVRVLRTVKRLADAGLVVLVCSPGGRMANVRLTPAGQTAVAELRSVSADCSA